MTASNTAQAAYTRPELTTKTPRATEYELLARATRKLIVSDSNQKHDFQAFADALHTNRILWTNLAAFVADEGNALPKKLRAQIFYLAEFTAHQTRKVFKGEADVKVLIDVNSSVMEGLCPGVQAE